MIDQTFPENSRSGKSKSEAWAKRIVASDQILQSKKRIAELWEKKVREQVIEAKHEGSTALVNSLPIFIDELSFIVKQEKPSPESLSELAMAKLHGESRTLFRGYSLSQLLVEFSIVREVLSDELNARGVLNHEIHSIIDKTIDRSISLAVMEFERIQNENLNKALELAESSNRDLEQMAFVAAHDLNSPLATVSSLVDLLVGEMGAGLNSKSEEYVQYIKETLVRMRSLIGNLLEFARLTKIRKPFENFPLGEALKASLQNLKSEIEASQAKIVSSTLPRVCGDQEMLTQVFQNLITNAIKYRGSRSPEIQISYQDRDPDHWLVIVKDNGIGFDEKEKEEIFSLYKRVQDSANVPGVGIGLATCRKVVELHRGKIWAESAPGQGATFYFTLPKDNISDFH